MIQKRLISSAAAIAAITLTFSPQSQADTTLWNLSSGPLTQDWTNTGLITTSDSWTGVPSIMGYRGDDAVAGTAVDPQTIVVDLSGVIDVNANQTNPNTFTSGGVSEFDTLANPVVALQGSGTADFPNLVLYLDGTGVSDIAVSYLLRDVDGSTDNSIQPFALQYRLANTGDFTNLASGFVADASSGPSLATLETPVTVTLPADANGAPYIEVRIITNNAASNDEWVGVDNISVAAVPEPSVALMAFIGGVAVITRRRRA